MLNKIIDGISVKLNETFGDGYRIYTESVKQGLKEPCFFIQLVNPGNKELLNIRFKRNNLFVIQYFPATDKPKAECNNVLDALFIALEEITVDGDPQRGINRRGEMVNGVLSFFVNYNMVLKKVKEETPMETLELPKIKTKGKSNG